LHAPRGAIEARAKSIEDEMSQDRLDEVVSFCCRKKPTSAPFDQAGSVEVFLEERQERELIPRLKRRGTGIITSLNKVIRNRLHSMSIHHIRFSHGFSDSRGFGRRVRLSLRRA